jgi:hypothetical protein
MKTESQKEVPAKAPPFLGDPGPQRRMGIWLVVSAAAMAAVYAVGWRLAQDRYFGIAQQRHFGFFAAALLNGLVFPVLLVAAHRVLSHPDQVIPPFLTAFFRAPWGQALVGLASIVLFWTLRTNFLNGDHLAVGRGIQAGVEAHGYQMTHDEMLELFVHSKFWIFCNLFEHIHVFITYQILNVLVGGVVMVGLMTLARQWGGGRPLTIFGALCGTAWLGLYFGDVENYALVNATIVLWLIATHWSLTRGLHAAVPAALFSLAMAFHLLTGWLGPGLVAFFWFIRKAERQRELPLAALMSILPLAVVALLFHLDGQSISGLWTGSHASSLLRPEEANIVTPNLSYYFQMANLALLLCPSLPLLALVVMRRGAFFDDHFKFLFVLSLSALLFCGVWYARIGVYNDWKLFAVCGLIWTLTIWYALVRAGDTPLLQWGRAAWVWLAVTHSFGWHLHNHFNFPQI